MGTVIKLHILARAVLCGSRAARTSSVIPYTRRFFASSSTKNQLAAGIEPRVFTPRSSAIEQAPPTAGRQPGALSQNANGVNMPMTKNTGRRLLRTREALELSQAEFCRQIGVERNLYNPFEKGRRRITIDVAMKIRDRYGITLDWIYAGDPHALPSHLYRKLVVLAA
jgi:DNA-binding XRE family transcriptional regulator